MLPRYDGTQSYEWNYTHAPAPLGVDVPPLAGQYEFLGRPVGSPLGVAAGPLLNGAWLLYYAGLGFDVLTYKTVRTRARDCYPLPNVLPVAVEQVSGSEPHVPRASAMNGTWAVSFGMPSMPPEVWKADVRQTRELLAKDKLLSVSVVATEQPGWTITELADDYALAARWAVESGADCVEANFSCPNVCSSDGQLYQHPGDAARCAEAIRAAIGDVPLIIKVGHQVDEAAALAMIDALAPSCTALSMTNSVALPVADENGELLFGGQRRGICGRGIREASIAQTALMHELIRRRGYKLRLIGVGGAFDATDVRRYLAAGAEAVHLATAVMIEPDVAIGIRRAWSNA
ncbi:MAG: hypothetical protein JNM18_17195 [Planctomycetaceae bacterium]|nr:hypothetical protein [Planctomycetaceae bacterium]